MAFWDVLFREKSNGSKATGAKIRTLRIRQKVSVKELGEACGVNENSIRNYELGIRQVGEDKLRLIAARFGVPVEALRDRGINSYVDVMHILFELSDSYELMPAALPQEPQYALLSKDEVLINALKAWYMKQRELEQKKITLDELEAWKDSFPLQCEDIAEISPDEASPEHRYSDFERIAFLRKSLRDLRLIVNDKSELISNALVNKDFTMAMEHVRTLQNTIDTLAKLDIDKYG